MKNMYAVKCIYKSTLYKLDDNSEIKYPNQFEERIFLIKAKSLEDADSKCEKYALEYEDSYINPYGEIVKTTLYEILDVYQIFDTNKKNNIEVTKEVILYVISCSPAASNGTIPPTAKVPIEIKIDNVVVYKLNEKE